MRFILLSVCSILTLTSGNLSASNNDERISKQTSPSHQYDPNANLILQQDLAYKESLLNDQFKDLHRIDTNINELHVVIDRLNNKNTLVSIELEEYLVELGSVEKALKQENAATSLLDKRKKELSNLIAIRKSIIEDTTKEILFAQDKLNRTKEERFGIVRKINGQLQDEQEGKNRELDQENLDLNISQALSGTDSKDSNSVQTSDLEKEISAYKNEIAKREMTLRITHNKWLRESNLEDKKKLYDQVHSLRLQLSILIKGGAECIGHQPVLMCDNFIRFLDGKNLKLLTGAKDYINKVILEGKPFDVHAFNKSLAPFNPCVMSLNNSLGLTPHISAEVCIIKLKALRQKCLSKDMGNFADKEMQTLVDYLSNGRGAKPEEETGLCPLYILSYCVDYLEKSFNQENEVFNFLRILEENTRENGGCYPGYVGRIVAFNYGILFNIMQKRA